MKRLTKITLGLSLIFSSSLMANDTISVLYPLEDNDTPDYILNSNQYIHSKVTNSLAKVSISKESLVAFYPIENNDTPDYLLDYSEDNESVAVYSALKSSLSEKAVCAIYPEEHTDSPRKSC
ncbi:MAG: hypothetical protein CL624_01155 [Arcobacter sp.]|nr:hypothetical protein [Arcobacter sp.]|tara:strand:+ start:208 stop:573 length:366 start_codon:yes stop_codon:yes gene_type:complete